jgi:hypothetical protein
MPAAAREKVGRSEDLYIGWGIEGNWGGSDGYFNTFNPAVGSTGGYSYFSPDNVEAMAKGPRVSFARAN